MSEVFDFLLDTEPEFDFLEGVEGGDYYATLATGDFFETWREIVGTTQQWEYVPVVPPKQPTTTRNQRDISGFIKFFTGGAPARWPWQWPPKARVLQRPEGHGKSSMVRELVDREYRVVFCSKSNAQLIEQEQSFRERWPDLRIVRRRSKAQHLKEQLAKVGIEVTLHYYTPSSPYSPAIVDEPTTRQVLAKALSDAGVTGYSAHEVFQRLYTDYTPPAVVGKDTDVLLMTLTQFQAMCTSPHRPWWSIAGYGTGYKRVVAPRFGSVKVVPIGTKVPRFDPVDGPQYTQEVGQPNIVVIIDDPDRTDFDVRRLVEDEDTAKRLWSAKRGSGVKREMEDPAFFRAMGLGTLTAQRCAEHWAAKNSVHALEAFEGDYYESRPEAAYVGHRLQRWYRKGGPRLIVTTTEHITARLAARSLTKTLRMGDERVLNARVPVTTQCHVTLLVSRIVRKANHALLLLIVEQLRAEFPAEEVKLIADGLALDTNLQSTKGRNDLSDSINIVKLSIPNPTVVKNLWAQFPQSERPRVLNALLLADLANQAIGRSQGNRFNDRPCIVVVDPIYAAAISAPGMLRYHCTPWSWHRPTSKGLTYYGPQTNIEKRFEYLLRVAEDWALNGGGWRAAEGLGERSFKLVQDWFEKRGKELTRSDDEADAAQEGTRRVGRADSVRDADGQGRPDGGGPGTSSDGDGDAGAEMAGVEPAGGRGGGEASRRRRPRELLAWSDGGRQDVDADPLGMQGVQDLEQGTGGLGTNAAPTDEEVETRVRRRQRRFTRVQSLIEAVLRQNGFAPIGHGEGFAASLPRDRDKTEEEAALKMARWKKVRSDWGAFSFALTAAGWREARQKLEKALPRTQRRFYSYMTVRDDDGVALALSFYDAQVPYA